ncbi:hypothetical protein BDY21DRAFT_353869 [Lineolata rhizophorae]|uniref:Uncharacterized protein n=1 Tax=Lineolata rhizophorae TaxID=578093 RepID=A0A6A6NRW9_9PEZI|nr:hypothetical protein BDY21DRAFT_353869 [Lineolata rhizophorae]
MRGRCRLSSWVSLLTSASNRVCVGDTNRPLQRFAHVKGSDRLGWSDPGTDRILHPPAQRTDCGREKSRGLRLLRRERWCHVLGEGMEIGWACRYSSFRAMETRGE